MSVDLVVTDTRSIGHRVEAGLDQRTLRRLDIQPGEYVEIDGRDRTVAFAASANVAGDGVALGEHVRSNAAVDAGDRVTVSKATVSPAEQCTIAPTGGVEIADGEVPLADSLDGWPVSTGDVIDADLLEGTLSIPFVVTNTVPDGPVVVTRETQVIARSGDESVDERGWEPAGFEDVGGLDETLSTLRDSVLLPLERPDLFADFGEDPTAGVLLSGASGTGKTLLARALATETDAHVTWLDASLVSSLRSDEIATEFDRVVREARAHAPSLVVFDELDAVVPASGGSGGRDRRVVAHVRSMLDALADEPGVVVLATAADPDDVHGSLRRGERLEVELEVGVPDEADRQAILSARTRHLPLGIDVDLPAVAARTHGFVGADLAALAAEAVLEAARRSAEEAGQPTVEMRDFERALDRVSPSAMRELQAAVPSVTYEDVGGVREAKRELVRTVEWPLRYPELFDALQTEPPRGVLLYGPPGTGKTMLAKAVANATDANFISVKGPEVLDKYVGESEAAVRKIFEKARQNAPAVVFFDEVDAIAPRRGQEYGTHAVERVVSQLLTELDGLEPLEDVVVLGATNRPDVIDPAILRPGRFERLVEVPLPDREARREIFEVHTEAVPMAGIDLDTLAAETEGYSGSDIAALVREASLLAIETFVTGSGRADPTVTADHFARALATVEPTLARGGASSPDPRSGPGPGPQDPGADPESPHPATRERDAASEGTDDGPGDPSVE